jgi:acetyl esterase/lipase
MQTFRYAETAGVKASLQSLDVYGGEAGQKRPILAFIHGGGWTSGNKSDPGHGKNLAPPFVDAGMVFASINYRLSPAVKHPAHIDDVAAAIAWLQAHAIEIGGDPDRIYVMGHSSGAQLAALAAVDERRLGKQNLPLTAIKGVIALDGSGYDTVRYAAVAGRLGPRGGEMFEEAFGKDQAAYADGSPTLLAASGKGIAPFLIVASPRPVPRAQAQGLAAAIARTGAKAEIIATEQGHMEIIQDIGNKNDKVTAAIMAALKSWGA